MAPTRKRASPAREPDPVIATKLNDYNRGYQSEAADFTLVSSDGFQFRVEKIRLIVASPVFKCMFEAGNDPDNRLELTDKQLEISSVLSPVLDLIHGKEIRVSRKDSIGTRSPSVVRTLQKYECDSALTLLRALIRIESLCGKSSEMQLFEVAAILNDVVTCRHLIDRCATWYYSPRPSPDLMEEGLDNNRAGVRSCMDPTNWRRALFKTIATDYIRALMRGIAKGRNGDIVDWKVAADEFQRLLQMIVCIR